MTTSNCLRYNNQGCSFSCIPVAIIRDVVFGFLSENDAFKARGTCSLFSRAYFVQAYKCADAERVVFMLSRGYHYPKLKNICLTQFDNQVDLSPLKCLLCLE